MSLTKIGLTMADYVVLDGDLTLAQSNSQIRLRNLGKDYLGAGKSILMWADYSARNMTFSKGDVTALSIGSGGAISGGKFQPNGTERLVYNMVDNFVLGLCTFVIRFTTTFDGTPADWQTLLEFNPAGSASPNFMWVIIRRDDGALNVFVRNKTDSGDVISVRIPAEDVNGIGNDWDSTKEVYVAITIDHIDNKGYVYAGRVEGGIATRFHAGTALNPSLSTGQGNFLVGGGGLGGASETNTSEVLIFDGPISTAASFTIPAEISRIYNDDDPAKFATLAEIDLEGIRTIDFSAININELNDPFDDLAYQFSYHNTSGSPTWRGEAGVVGGDPLDLAALQALPDQDARYFQLRPYIQSDGIWTAWLGDTGDFLTVGNVTTAMPDTPTFSAIAAGDSKFTITVTPSSTNYDHTIILYRKWSPAKAVSWSSQQYDGAAGTEADVDVSGLTNYKWYEVVLYDVSGTDAFSETTVSRLIYVTDKSSPLSDRMIAVRDRISSSISEFSMVRITPELGFFGQQKGAYCVVTSGGGPRLYENAGWGPMTIRVGVFAELQRDIYTEETVIGNSTTGDKGINDLCDEIVALFDDYVPADNSPAFHFQASRVSAPQKIEAADPESWLRMQVVDIKVQFEET